MHAPTWLTAGFVLTSTAWAQDGPAGVPEATRPPDVVPPISAPSRIVEVTVYRGHALVTREVTMPAGRGVAELVVTPLPAQAVVNSLYAEGAGGARVLSTRHRTRAVQGDVRKEVREAERTIKDLESEARRIGQDLSVRRQNLEFLQKLENFTAATMQGLAEKGLLRGDTTLRLTRFVMDGRAETSAASVALEEKARANVEATAFARKQLAELAAGSRRVETDAVIVVDREEAAAGPLRLNYLVGAAAWHPQYRLRAGGDDDPVQLESLAAVEQQSGEDWTDARLTLSTAEPSFQATLPDLIPLDLAVGDEEEADETPQTRAASTRDESRACRDRARQELIEADPNLGNQILNRAAALEQAAEFEARDDDGKQEPGISGDGEGPNVTLRLSGRSTVPSRRDFQLIEVEKVALAAQFFAKAVPILSPRVYRLATLTNSGPSVLLPGEATMFVGSDFVGRMTLPQVAVGEPFTVGFGVDPQLQVGRRLVKRARTVQGGNQVQTYEFRMVARNFKSVPTKLQLWDRLPRAESKSEAVAIDLTTTFPALSADPLYLRISRPDNLLRWDLDLAPGTVGEKAQVITYAFKMELARDSAIHYLSPGGLKEMPIGGMGGMGGGFRALDSHPKP